MIVLLWRYTAVFLEEKGREGWFTFLCFQWNGVSIEPEITDWEGRKGINI